VNIERKNARRRRLYSIRPASIPRNAYLFQPEFPRQGLGAQVDITFL
jgi:hypothetical protein